MLCFAWSKAKEVRMQRRDFLKAVGVGAASFLVGGCGGASIQPSGKAAKRKPNFVFIFIDDLGYKDLAFMGSKYYETPNIDKLASEGVVFTNAYSNAPNCAPTRACLMSGQYTPRHGIYTVGSPERGKAKLRKLIPTPNTTELSPDIVTIPEALKAGGYRSACIGKWHLGEKEPFRPQDQGFDVVYERTKRSHFTDDGEYLTDRLTTEAVNFIESNKDNPFFLYLSHHAVHTPIQAKPEMIEKYKAKEPIGGHDNPKYAAMIESVDESVAMVLAALDRLGLRDNTVVFFFSDNGGYANVTSMLPLRGSKGMLYEGGIRVPAIVRCPGHTKLGSVCDSPVIGIDFYPTMLDMAGVKNPKGYILDGRSITTLLDDESAGFESAKKKFNNRAIFWHFPAYLEPYNDSQKPWRTTPASAIRKGPWKLIEFFEDGRTELYNLENDISEKNNLAASMPKKASQLHAELKRWQTQLNAPVPKQLNSGYDPAARAAQTPSSSQPN